MARGLRFSLLIAALMTVAITARADDLPQRFIGVWMAEDTMHPGHAETCSRADYNPGYQGNERIVLIDRKGLTPVEGECRIVSVKAGIAPRDPAPNITSPVTVQMLCTAEGEEKRSPLTAVWAVHSIAGQTIMVQVNVKDPTKIDLYQRCP